MDARRAHARLPAASTPLMLSRYGDTSPKRTGFRRAERTLHGVHGAVLAGYHLS